MAELDVCFVSNPTGENFVVRFNGELYTVPPEGKHFPQFLSFHIAKHLSDSLLSTELIKLKQATKKMDNPYNPAVAQLQVYDNPKRRIALYDILGTKELVQACINSYPFKDFIGDMKEYDEYVAKKETVKTKASKKEE